MVTGFTATVDPCWKVPTRSEYEELLRQHEAGKIVFYFDPAQCRDFLLRLDTGQFQRLTGISMRHECTVIRAITYGIEPISLLLVIASAPFWLGWYGLIVTAAVYLFWSWLKATSCLGRQHLWRNIAVFSLGVIAAVWFRNHGAGYVVFMTSLSTLYLAEKMLYALPVWHFSKLALSSYELVRFAYGHTSDTVTQGPMMWHRVYPLPQPELSLPSPKVLAASHLFHRASGKFLHRFRSLLRL